MAICVRVFFSLVILCVPCFGNDVCLVGIGAPSPIHIKNVVTCGDHEKCALEQYVTPVGLVHYDASCRDARHCGGSTVKDHNVEVCSECCHGDLCSATLCHQGGYDPNSGPICFDCSYPVDSPDKCDKITQCSRDQVCGTYQVDRGQYLSQCIDRPQCDFQQSHNPCVSCCNTTLCNRNCSHTGHVFGKQCSDDTQCSALLVTFKLYNMNLCDQDDMKIFCNETCGLCPSTTPMPTTPHPCRPSPCIHGVCQVNGTGHETCFCDVGYMGEFCEQKDACYFQPCHNGATCTVPPTGGFQCHCLSQFTGIFCDTVITPCLVDPCNNNGTCAVYGSTFKCTCNIGYGGNSCDTVLKDCMAIQRTHPDIGNEKTDLFPALIDGKLTQLRCDVHTDGGGWTILMNRIDGSEDFVHKDLTEYALGFGNIHANYWIGLEKMHTLTTDGRRYELRVEVTDASGILSYEIYDDFSIGSGPEFVLHVSKFKGTAGDSLSGHSGFGFSTLDVDRDNNAESCAKYLQGNWWFHDCYDSCLTCAYLTPGTNNCRSMSWNSVKYCVALRTARMMVRPLLPSNVIP